MAIAGPITGRFAAYGAELKAGAEVAVEEINARGGVMGEPLRLSIGDDGCNPGRAAATAQSLVAKGVRLVAGHYCASLSLGAAPIYAAAGILQITPMADNARPREARTAAAPTSFTLSGAGLDQGEVAGRFLSESGATRIAILHDKTVRARSLANTVRQAISPADRVVLFEPIVPSEKDYGVVVARLKAAAPHFVYFAGQATEAGIVLRQMRSAGVMAVLIGSDTLSEHQYWEQAGGSANGTLVTFAGEASGGVQASVVGHRIEARGVRPAPLALRAYIAVKMWAQAAEAARSLEAVDVGARLAATPVETILGRVTFDAGGDGNLPLYAIREWRDGALREIVPP